MRWTIPALVMATALTAAACSPSPGDPARAWQTIAAAGVRWEVPPDWIVAAPDEVVESSDGTRLEHLADFGPYTCQGAEYGRAVAGVATGARSDAALADLAATVATDHYSEDGRTARVVVSPPTPVVRDGVGGVLVRADARADVTDPCVGRAGTVTVIGLGSAVVVLAADTEAGPEQPEPLLGEDTARAIVESVRPSG